jgi:hypothetical protein
MAALREKGEGLAALGDPEDCLPVSVWRPRAWRRVTALALALVAVGLAIAVVTTGPPRPVTYDVRLPLLILAGGALVNGAQWRRKVCITTDEIVVGSLVRTRRIPLLAIARAEMAGSRVTIRTVNGRKAVVRAITDPSVAHDFVNAVVTATGSAAGLSVGIPPAAVPAATPWLIMPSTVGVAALAAKGYTAHPALVIAALVAVAVVSCAALGRSWLHQRFERVSDPGS